MGPWNVARSLGGSAARVIELSQAPVAFVGSLAGLLVAVLGADAVLRLSGDVVAACCFVRFAVLIRSVSASPKSR